MESYYTQFKISGIALAIYVVYKENQQLVHDCIVINNNNIWTYIAHVSTN